MTTLKEKLTSAPVLVFPSFDRPFTVETDASISGIGAVLSQPQEDQKLHPVAYVSRALSPAERNNSITELETLAVVWALTRYHSYLYGQSVMVLTDHAAVRALLETPNPSGKHVRWWMKVYDSGLKAVKIVYRAGRLNSVADALSRCPTESAPAKGVAEQELQVASVQSEETRGHSSTQTDSEEIRDLLKSPPHHAQDGDFAVEQRKDPFLKEMIEFCEQGTLPAEEQTARRILLQKPMFTLEEGILYYLDQWQRHQKRVVVPSQLSKPAGALMQHWWWDGMYRDVVKFMTNCPQCTIVTGGGRIIALRCIPFR